MTEEAREKLIDNNLKARSDLIEMAGKQFTDSIDKIAKSAEKHSFFLDKALLTISSGAIGLILTVYQFIFERELSCITIWALYLSITFFALTIVAVLVSFFFVRKDHVKSSELIRKWYKEHTATVKKIVLDKSLGEQQGILKELIKEKNFTTENAKYSRWCNNAASILITLAIFSGIFLFLSIS